MKRINTWFGLVLPLFVFGFLRADDLQGGANNQTQAIEQVNDLAWPKTELLDSSLHWQSHADLAHKCLLVHHLDPKDPAATQVLHEVDLQGERFVTTNIPMASSHYLDWDSAIDEILNKAGFGQEIPIPGRQALLETQKETTLHHGEFVNHTKGYMKRSKNSIRLILVTQEIWKVGLESVGNYQWKPVKREIFVSSNIPLEQILRENKH